MKSINELAELGLTSSIEQEPSISYDEGAMKVLSILEGYKLRFKELHWFAVNKSIDIHECIDDIIDCVSTTEDLFSEVYQGIVGVIKPGTLGIEIPIETNTTLACGGLISRMKEVISTYSFKEHEMMKGILEDMIKDLYKFKYLLNGR